MWTSIIIYILLDTSKKYDFLVSLIIMLAVAVTLSGVTKFVNVFSNNFVFYLGKISLPIYIVQTLFRFIVEEYFTTYSAVFIISFFVVGSILAGVILYYLAMSLERVINKKIKKLKKEDA